MSIEQTLQHTQAWVTANPLLFSLIVWPAVTGIINWIWKPRSAMEYAQMNPNAAGLLKLIAGAGFDPRKVLEGASAFLTGKSIPLSQAQADDLLKKASIKPPPPVEDPKA